MFGFSLPKIILLIIIIFVVWQVFRIIEKRNKLLQSLDENKIYNKEVIYETIKKYKNFYKFENFNKTSF